MPERLRSLTEDARFRVLRVLQANPKICKRDLVVAVGFSLGGARYALTALIETGLVELGNFSAAPDKRRYTYILTPQGVAENASITRRFLACKVAEYEALRAEIFAALDVKSGLVIGECMPRHRAKEFQSFLRRIDRAVKKPRDIRLVLDNYATHKTPEVLGWLEKHPRFKLHFTPTSASWMNLVERFFAEIKARRIRRGSYSSVEYIKGAIYDYLLQHNAKPKPFVWSKTAEEIIPHERRAIDALYEIRGNR